LLLHDGGNQAAGVKLELVVKAHFVEGV
jgi:hypothetical protein